MDVDKRESQICILADGPRRNTGQNLEGAGRGLL